MIPAVTRRALIGGAGASMLACGGPALAEANTADEELRQLLDEAAASTDPARWVERLTRVDAAVLSVPARLDLVTALAGLRMDAALAAQFPEPQARMTAARYRLLLRRIASDDAAPEAALRRLERERRALLARANRLMASLGWREGSVGARFSALWGDPRWLYRDDDAGRDAAVADMNRTLAVARTEALRDFPHVPAHCFDVAVHRMSRADEAAGKGGYRALPTATKSGAYDVDLKQITRRPRWTLPSVVHHELLPGHMVQLPIEALARPHPLRLRYAPGFAEGWAIHAEQRVDYGDDLMAELGKLHWLLFRVGRALIDLRVHLHGWTLDRARAQLIEWQGEPAYFAPYDTELKRIAAEPATRVAEALSWLTMADLARSHPAQFRAVALPYGRMRNDMLRRMIARRSPGLGRTRHR